MVPSTQIAAIRWSKFAIILDLYYNYANEHTTWIIIPTILTNLIWKPVASILCACNYLIITSTNYNVLCTCVVLIGPSSFIFVCNSFCSVSNFVFDYNAILSILLLTIGWWYW